LSSSVTVNVPLGVKTLTCVLLTELGGPSMKENKPKEEININ